MLTREARLAYGRARSNRRAPNLSRRWAEVSYHHTNRIRDHLVPILEEGFRGQFGGKGRKNKLSPATQNLLWQIGARLNEQTGSWSVSYSLLKRKTASSTSTIQRALEQLVDLGFLIRSSPNSRAPRSAFEYRLGPRLNCPPDCEHSADHLTKAELVIWRSNKQDTNQGEEIPKRSISQSEERSISQSAIAPLDRTLKEIKENRKKVGPCSFCRVDPEVISGIERRLHSDNCQELARIKKGKSWEIAIQKYGGEFAGLTSKDQQRAYWEDYSEFETRKLEQVEEKSRDKERLREKLRANAGEVELLPNWLSWLENRSDLHGEVRPQEVELAKKHSLEGNDLVPGRGSWEIGGWAFPADFERAPAEAAN